MARAAKEALDGADIYSGCCTLKIEYAKVRILSSVQLPEAANNLRLSSNLAWAKEMLKSTPSLMSQSLTGLVANEHYLER